MAPALPPQSPLGNFTKLTPELRDEVWYHALPSSHAFYFNRYEMALHHAPHSVLQLSRGLRIEALNVIVRHITVIIRDPDALCAILESSAFPTTRPGGRMILPKKILPMLPVIPRHLRIKIFHMTHVLFDKEPIACGIRHRCWATERWGPVLERLTTSNIKSVVLDIGSPDVYKLIPVNPMIGILKTLGPFLGLRAGKKRQYSVALAGEGEHPNLVRLWSHLVDDAYSAHTCSV